MLKKYFKGSVTRFNALISIMMIGSGRALAALPDAGDIAGDADTDSPLTMFGDLVSSGIGLAATALAAAVVIGMAFHLYSAFTEAREKRDWKSFGITASVGTVVIVGSILLALLAITYAEPA
jgi:hypothetical protein